MKLAELSNNSFERKNVTFWGREGAKHTLTPSYIFSGGQGAQPPGSTPLPDVVWDKNMWPCRIIISSAPLNPRTSRRCSRNRFYHHHHHPSFVITLLQPHRLLGRLSGLLGVQLSSETPPVSWILIIYLSGFNSENLSLHLAR